MTVPRRLAVQDIPGRVLRTDDPDQPVALLSEDGDRLTAYDAFLAYRSRELTVEQLFVETMILLVWQRHLWANPFVADLRGEAEVVGQKFGPAPRSMESLTAPLFAYLDFCEQRDLVHSLFLASEDEFAALLARGSTTTG